MNSKVQVQAESKDSQKDRKGLIFADKVARLEGDALKRSAQSRKHFDIITAQ